MAGGCGRGDRGLATAGSTGETPPGGVFDETAGVRVSGGRWRANIAVRLRNPDGTAGQRNQPTTPTRTPASNHGQGRLGFLRERDS